VRVAVDRVERALAGEWCWMRMGSHLSCGQGPGVAVVGRRTTCCFALWHGVLQALS
jgi:hypothetical protein